MLMLCRFDCLLADEVSQNFVSQAWAARLPTLETAEALAEEGFDTRAALRLATADDLLEAGFEPDAADDLLRALRESLSVADAAEPGSEPAGNGRASRARGSGGFAAQPQGAE